MTQFRQDVQVRKVAFAVTRLSGIAFGLLIGANVLAEVTLSNSVQKFEDVVNQAGDAERQLVEALSVIPGDELQYTITFTNEGVEAIDAGSIVITNPIPETTEYLDGTATGAGTDILFSVDGVDFATPAELTVEQGGFQARVNAEDYSTIRWTFSPELAPGETGNVSFNVRLK